MVFLLRGFAIFAIVATRKSPPFCDGPSLGRNAAKSFAASKAYDISTRQIVAIHTQRREKAAAPLSMARETARRQSRQKSRKRVWLNAVYQVVWVIETCPSQF
jgi:hypothetical protein